MVKESVMPLNQLVEILTPEQLKETLTQQQLREYRKGMYPEYKKRLKNLKISKMELYDELAKKYLYKNGMVIFHTIRRIEGKNPKKTKTNI